MLRSFKIPTMQHTGPNGPADRIRHHLSTVESLRNAAVDAGIDRAVLIIKQLQSRRFKHTYQDFLTSAEYALAARFFLDELYGVRDFRTRDQQFSRIAGGLARLFPHAVAELAIDLTELHALTERLDHSMGVAWLAQPESLSAGARYLRVWEATGGSAERQRQLVVVSRMGTDLESLTRKRSLRTALRLMRGPARAAGLDALQQFLEAGFDAFASMSEPRRLMDAIAQRESAWLERLFRDPDGSCATELDGIWSLSAE